MPPKRRAIAPRGLAAHEQLRAVATGRRSRIPLTGIGDMPLKCFAGDGCQPPKEGVVRRRPSEGRRQPTRHVETSPLGAQKFRRRGTRVSLDAVRDRWSKTTAARQQAGGHVAIIGLQQVASRHVLSGAQDFRLPEKHLTVFGLSGDAQFPAPGVGEKTKR